MPPAYQIVPIGVVRNTEAEVFIDIFPEYADGLLGLTQFSHIHVLYWFDRNDTPEQRCTLRVHPCGNEHNPLTGVFATHSPARPNLIALTRCKILSIAGRRIFIDAIDALDGSPVIDIKAYFPETDPETGVRFPDWEGRPPPAGS